MISWSVRRYGRSHLFRFIGILFHPFLSECHQLHQIIIILAFETALLATHAWPPFILEPAGIQMPEGPVQRFFAFVTGFRRSMAFAAVQSDHLLCHHLFHRCKIIQVKSSFRPNTYRNCWVRPTEDRGIRSSPCRPRKHALSVH